MLAKKIPQPNRGSANRVVKMDLKNAVESSTLKDFQSTKAKIDEAIALLNSPLYTGDNIMKSQFSGKTHAQHNHSVVSTDGKPNNREKLFRDDQRSSSISKINTSSTKISLIDSDTPSRLKTIPKSTADVSPMTKEISRWTSLTKEKLCKEFYATLQMNVTARRKFCTAELRYAKRDGNYETVKKAEKYLKDLSLMEEKTRNQVGELLKDYNKVPFLISL